MTKRGHKLWLGKAEESQQRFLIALYYFNVKRQWAYIKSIITRHLNKLAK